MSLYAIGDLHLSLSTDKSMDVFGEAWEGYVDKLRAGFSGLSGDDVCVLCGDISWAGSLEQAEADFRFIQALPGRKVILKGNHDYWWSTGSKLRAFFEKHGFDSMELLHNNAVFYDGATALCGTRGWFYEPGRSGLHDRKLLDRECQRLEASLKAAGERDKYVFLHYPPKYGQYQCPEILELLRRYGVKMCFSGHLHAHSLRLAFNGTWEGVEHRCVSADAIAFKPCKIL